MSAFVASVDVKPLEVKKGSPSYFGFIISSEGQNHTCAWLNFNTDGYIYLIIIQFQNGIAVKNYPSWPCVNTTLRWKLNETYNIKLFSEKQIHKLFINGFGPFIVEAPIELGNIGLSSFRMRCMFKYFSLINIETNIDFVTYIKTAGNW
jgi:hypothetical protein